MHKIQALEMWTYNVCKMFYFHGRADLCQLSRQQVILTWLNFDDWTIFTTLVSIDLLYAKLLCKINHLVPDCESFFMYEILHLLQYLVNHNTKIKT